MSTVSDYYAAGLIDGEGSILLTRKKTNEWRAPVVSITSTTREFLEAMKDTYGGSVSHHTTRNDRWKDAWSWKVSSDRAIEVMRRVYPYLLEPTKKARAGWILDHYKRVTPRNGRYTDEMKREKILFEASFLML